MKWFNYPIIFMTLLTGCAVGPDFKRPTPVVPKAYIAKQPTTLKATAGTAFGETQRLDIHKDIPAQWWALFHSKPLNELVITSFKHNPNIDAAKAELHAALETVYAQQGSLLPFLGLGFSPTKQQVAKILTSILASNKYIYSLYTGHLFVSYTPDVFGGIRRQIESLTAQAEAQYLQLEATYLTLASNVVNAAIQEAGLRAQIQAIHTMIHSHSKLLSIMRRQKAYGDTSIANIALQESVLAQTEAMLIPLEKQLAIQRDLLNALTGRLPDDARTPQFTFEGLTLPQDLPISLPSTLLEHRPDIRAAEAQMHSANALIGVAISNRLPNVTLGYTAVGTAATSLSTLFLPNENFWSLAGIFTQPIFDAGTLLHRQRYAQAIYDQAAAQYKSTVINAFQNVADTLKSIRLDGIALRAATRAERAAFKAWRISRRQYALGDTSMIIVLSNEQLYQQAKINLIQAQTNRLTDTAALFQALGGGWWQKACVAPLKNK